MNFNVQSGSGNKKTQPNFWGNADADYQAK